MDTPDGWWSEVVKRAFVLRQTEAFVAWSELKALREENARLRAERDAALVHGPEDMVRALELLDQAATDYRRSRDAAEAKLAKVVEERDDAYRCKHERDRRIGELMAEVGYLTRERDEARARLAKVVMALRGQATRLLHDGGVCFCDLCSDECIGSAGCVEANEALAAAKGEQ